MKIRVHYTLGDGTEDSIVLEHEDFETLKEMAHSEVEKRGGKDPWTEEL